MPSINPEVKIGPISMPIGEVSADSLAVAQAIISCRFVLDFFPITKQLDTPMTVVTNIFGEEHQVEINPTDTEEVVWEKGIKFGRLVYDGAPLSQL